MTGHRPRLLMVYEPEDACRARLAARGFAPERIVEISSYLAQATDIAADLGSIGEECARRGMDFRAVALDEAADAFARGDPATTLVWTLTDGIAYFRGGVAPALARLNGLATIGADDSVFALCQDKFRSGAVLRALGLPAPDAGLARDAQWIAPPPPSSTGYFVKPNRLGSKIGIWPDSRCRTAAEALALSRRIHAFYRDDAIVQPYVAGRNVRASFLAVDPRADMSALGVFLVDSGGDFQTMADSLALYGDTGAQARAAGGQGEPMLLALGDAQPAADALIRDLCRRLASGLALADVFSVDLRVEADDRVHLIEFEICPGLPCFDFRDYCRRQWGLTLGEALAQTAAHRLAGAGAQPMVFMQT